MVSTGNAVWSSRFAFIMASVGFAVGLATFGVFPTDRGKRRALVNIYLLRPWPSGFPV